MTLTWLHLVGDHILGSLHDVHVGLERSVEGLNLTKREVQHRIPGGVVVVYPHNLTLRINADHKVEMPDYR